MEMNCSDVNKLTLFFVAITVSKTLFIGASLSKKPTFDGGVPRYGAGKSQFYAEADPESHDRVSQLTPVKPASNQDTTVYLSKSTFYETNQLCQAEGCSFFGNPQTSNYCSKCYKQVLQDQCK